MAFACFAMVLLASAWPWVPAALTLALPMDLPPQALLSVWSSLSHLEAVPSLQQEVGRKLPTLPSLSTLLSCWVTLVFTSFHVQLGDS